MKQPIKMTPGDDTHLSMLMAPCNLNFFVGKDREDLLAYGRAAFEAGKAGQCLHQITEPQAAPAAVAVLTTQQICDRFAFLEGAVNETTYLRIVEVVEEIQISALAATPAAEVAAPVLVDDMKQELMALYNEIMKQGRGMHYWNYAAAVLARYRGTLAAPLAAASVVLPEPADWKLVPMATTTDMRIAYQRNRDDGFEAAYRAMLEAAPAAAPVMMPEKSASFETWAKTEGGPFALHNCGPYNRDAMKLAGMAWHASALLATATGLPAQAVPLKLIEAINTTCGGNEWQGDALAPDLLEPACRAVASLAPQAQGDARDAQLLAFAVSEIRRDEMGHAPVLYVSKGQLNNHRDPDGPDSTAHGRYLPARITPAGKFTTPLFAVPHALTPAARDVLAERQRQITQEGWTPECDDNYGPGALADAGGCYAIQAYGGKQLPEFWPWTEEWWKPSDTPRRNLEKAGALILAEIERIDRAAIAAAKVSGGTPAHYLVDEHYPTGASERGAQAAQGGEHGAE